MLSRLVRPTQDLVATAATVGVVAAGLALFEAALIPGVVLGGAAVLAPKYLPRLGRQLRPLLGSAAGKKTAPAASVRGRLLPIKVCCSSILPRFAIKQAVAKTVTFRIIVTTLDFTTNYLVIGEFATAAGLSGFALVAGPVFYLVHEAAWNYFGPPIKGKAGRWGTAVAPSGSATPKKTDAEAPATGRKAVSISRPVAKTITFRTIATTMDFATTYAVVGDLATAATLSAIGFVVGPFVYLGHEMLWDRYGSPVGHTPPPPATPVDEKWTRNYRGIASKVSK